MNISDFDKNFKLPEINEKDIVWRNALDEPFSLHGIYYDKTENRYRRMPSDVSKTVSDGVLWATSCTAGGRLRFKTNSPYVAIKCIFPPSGAMNHMTIVGMNGFSLYGDGQYVQMYTPEFTSLLDCSGVKKAFSGIRYFLTEGEHETELYFPLYNGVYELFIGLKEGCSLEKPREYKHPKPVVFYGSSITQGGCASRPGNDYVSMLSRKLDTDIINLGFSGNAKGEKTMADYLASLDASVFVMDYDYNAPSTEHLQVTHYPMYRKIRDRHPDTPVLFITKPDFGMESNPIIRAQAGARREVVRSTYNKAMEEGDKNVAFIDGETLFGTDERDACTVDGCHPNDLGFYRMATTVYPVLKKLLD